MKFNHVIACSCSLYILIAELHFVYFAMIILLLIGILSFLFEIIMNNAAMNILLCIFLLTHVCIYVELMSKSFLIHGV